MIVLASHRCRHGNCRLVFHVWLAGDLWPAWHYDPNGPHVSLIDELGVARGNVPAAMLTRRELIALRHAEEVLRRPSPLMVAEMLETVALLVPVQWMGGAPVEAKAVADGLRKRAVLS